MNKDFRYKINKPHGIMFHHFKDSLHPDGQGAISADEFEEIILYIGPERIVSADEWMNKFLLRESSRESVCITFDDALKCQYDIAKPVLDKYGIKAFFFVYSSPFLGNIESLEVYRFFRSTCFDCVEDYYDAFFLELELGPCKDLVSNSLKDFIPSEYLKEYIFYTDLDRKFRYVRDKVLGPEMYHYTMDKMIKKFKLDDAKLLQLLWMNELDLKNLSEEGHIIGLHSFTHPTSLKDLSREEQLIQYTKNSDHLTSLLKERPRVMSHPCNSYSDVTLKLLEDLEISLGFRANMKDGFNSKYEIPREDHINILKEIRVRNENNSFHE